MDETAQAIARLREQSKPAKPSDTDREASQSPRPGIPAAASGSGNRKSGPVLPASSTRRRKSGSA